MFSIGVAQTRNSTEIQSNFKSIFEFLDRFKEAGVNLVLFPECALSGCSAKMKTCTREFLSEFLTSIQLWVNETGVDVILPTAVVENERVYNSVFWISKSSCRQLFKVGLTPSETKFFSVPENAPRKVIEIGGVRLAVLICREAQDEPWHHFSKDEVDAILWPGYWGWTESDEWTSTLTTGEVNTVLENMKSWRVPLIQSNFAFNDLEGYSGPGPIGRSVVVDTDNKLVHRGATNTETGFVVHIRKSGGRAEIVSCRDLVR